MIILKLNEVLNAKGKTAYQVAKATGLHQSVISKIRRNEAKMIALDVLDKLCENLECYPSDLLRFERNSKPQTVKPQIPKPDAVADDEILFSTAEVAKKLGLNERTVRDNYTSGKLPCIKRGTKRFVKESDFNAFRDSRNG